jgi:hypothetical protein
MSPVKYELGFYIFFIVTAVKASNLTTLVSVRYNRALKAQAVTPASS